VKIVVIGATGMIGQRIVQEAENRGHEVKQFTSKTIDILDTDATAQALSGYDVVVNATSGRHSTDLKAFYTDTTKALIAAVKKAGVRRYLMVGGAGSLEVAPGKRLVDTPEFHEDWKPGALAMTAALEIIRASDIDWTFLSPSALIMPGKRTGKIKLGHEQLLINGQGESYVSAEDYAMALVDEIEKPQHIRQRFTVVSLEK
jgi:putative NADH-flavin reductase